MLREKILKIVATELNLAPGSVSEDAAMGSIEAWDSMVQIGICLAIQGEFGIEISTDEIAESSSVRALIELVRRKTDS